MSRSDTPGGAAVPGADAGTGAATAGDARDVTAAHEVRDVAAGDGVPGDDVPGGDDAGASGERRAGRAPSRSLLVVAGIALAVVALIAAVALWPQRTAGQGATAGATAADTPPLLADVARRAPTPLPDATLPPLGDMGPDGGVDLADLRGEPTIINFWASWCAPCVREMPAMQRVAEEQGIRVIGVAYIDQQDQALALAREVGVTYDLVRDDDGDFGRQVGLLGTPTTLFVDEDGMIVRQLAAELSEQEIRQVIARDLR